ncbi:MAG: TraR/DksA family transcriptional regulator [Acidimicrobiales bacterium]
MPTRFHEPGPGHREAILSERNRAAELTEALAEGLGDIILSGDLANIDDEHDPDGATNAFERAQATALLEQSRTRVRELDAALDRLAAGTYGTCVGCGADIGAERLEALPATETCVRCAS